MRGHPIIGYEIVESAPLPQAVKLSIRHHEHYDGNGYPDGLNSEDIPLGSRIVLVAEAFDAITSDRPYQRARPKSEALHELKEHAGRQFDPEVVRVFESIIDRV
jgi:HD-GYP domain-containing protein (c-di-GMP phosphodiesterase class II)